MIRCYPIDGSEPFEVESTRAVLRVRRAQYPYGIPVTANHVACLWSQDGRRLAMVDGLIVAIESWRERAERLEREREEAMAAIDVRIKATGDRANAATDAVTRFEAQDQGDGLREALSILRRTGQKP